MTEAQLEAWTAYNKFRAGFVEAMDGRYYTEEWLAAELARGNLLFLNTDNAAIVFKIKEYPTGARSVNGILATGNRDDILNILIPEAEEFGRRIGCRSAFIKSREAWGRLLPDYIPYQFAIRKEL